MNNSQKKFMHSVAICLIAIAHCMYVHTSYAGDFEQDGVLFLNPKRVINKADIILFGSLKCVALPYKTLGKKFYKINVDEIIKGHMPKECLVVISMTTLSSYGIEPSIDNDVQYMLFLKEIKNTDKYAPKDIAFYSFVNNWKGIISLDSEAAEQRAVKNINKNYGINIVEAVDDFKDAMRYSLNSQRVKEPKEALSPRALAIYEGLELK